MMSLFFGDNLNKNKQIKKKINTTLKKKNNNENTNLKNHVKIPNNYTFNNIDLNNVNYKNKFKKPIGLYDPLGENINPLTGKSYQNLYQNIIDKYSSGSLIGRPYRKTYKNLSYIWTNMPMYSFITEMMDSIRNNQITMIKASTGVGKTVLTPKVALQAFNFQKKVLCTVPKRVHCAENADFSAQCLDVFLGKEVGYFYSGSKNMTKDSKLVFTTAGSLKSLITGSEPLLNDYQCILIDEVHERSIDTDFLMLMMKEILEKRPDFRLILMSATVDVSKFKNYYLKNNSKISFNEIIVEQKHHEVKVFYEKKQLVRWEDEAIQKAIHILKTTNEGDILIFMKSSSDGSLIKREIENKTKHLTNIHPFVTLLDSKTSKDDQKYATTKLAYLDHPENDPEHPFNRKIVIATNVAESSLTIDGVVFVIDNGWEIESSYYPKENARSLLPERISKASANQRKGRAGRTQPGECYRLYTEEEFEKFSEHTKPEIQKTDITSDLLDLFKLPYVKTLGNLKKYLNTLIDPPKESFIYSSINKLYALQAINKNNNDAELTQMGNAISKFRKFECHLSKAIIASAKLNCMYEVIHIILICFKIDNRIENLFNKYRPSSRNLSNKQKEKEEKEYNKLKTKFYSSYGDYITLLNVYESLKDHMYHYIKHNKVKNIENITNNEMNSNNEPNNLTTSKKLYIKEAKKWCYDNGIQSRYFIDQGIQNKSWDQIKNETKQITPILNKIIQTNNFKNLNNVLVSMNELNTLNKNTKVKQIKKVINKNKIKKGGSLLDQIYLNQLNDKVHNIILAFCVGGITNIAYIHDKKNMIYKTCFPQDKILCKIDRNSSLTNKNATQYIIYNELFMLKKGMSILKLNIVTKIPSDVLKIMKKYYEIYYKKCLDKTFKIQSKKKHIKKYK